jgi:hypothetical protein
MKLSYYEHDYEKDKVKLIITDGDRFTVKVKPEVTAVGFVTLVDGDKQYKLDATFDFSKVPARYHSLALQVVRMGGGRMHLPRRD